MGALPNVALVQTAQPFPASKRDMIRRINRMGKEGLNAARRARTSFWLCHHCIPAWNLLLKQAGEKYMATWWGMLLGSLLFLPALFFLGLPARSTWLLLAISAVVEAAYFIVLSFAYDDADFSLGLPHGARCRPGPDRRLVGPVPARDAHLRRHLWPGGHYCGFDDRRQQQLGCRSRASPHLRGVWPALLLALLISIYSVIDGAAVKRTGPFSYAALIYFVSSAYMTPYILSRHGWKKLKDEFVTYHWRLLADWSLIVVGYLLALWAYRLASVSYSGAIREVGVMMGAIAGWQFLGEKFGPVRVVGAIVIFGGILVIALFG